jgi:Na+-driven multidrug efflux pump
MLLGHLENSIDLQALGLATLTVGILHLSITVNFNGALDTLISQAYGAKDFKMCGIYLNR